MAQTVFESLDEVRAAVGTTLGTSGWLEVTQEQVDLFADATGDHQWIHVDVERATRTSPVRRAASPTATSRWRSPTWSCPRCVEVRDVSLGVNYGTGKVRFPAPVPVGGRVRGTAELVACDDVPGGVQTTIVITMEVEGGASPPAWSSPSAAGWPSRHDGPPARPFPGRCRLVLRPRRSPSSRGRTGPGWR